MAASDLKAVYGKSSKTRHAINKAIRAELVGGNDALDCIHPLGRLARNLREKDLPGAERAIDAVNALDDVLREMQLEIMRRYSFGNSGESQD